MLSGYKKMHELTGNKQYTVVCNALDTLLGDKKLLDTNLGSMGVATVTEQKDRERTVVHLLYAVPTKRGENTEIIEDIYPINGVELKLKPQHAIKRVYLAPQNEDVDFEEKNGYIYVKDITVNCHQMVVFCGSDERS